MIQMNSSDLFRAGKLEIAANKMYIRYMLSLRCKKIVKEVLGKMDINYELSIHGALCFPDTIPQKQQDEIRKNLKKHGLDLLSERKNKMIDRIISEIYFVIHCKDELPKLSFSDVLKINLDSDRTSIYDIFADVMGMSVIQFIVIQKVERIKELLLYHDLSLSDITNLLNYKNEQTLIAQFKKYTGLTPVYFKELKEKRMEIASQNANANYDQVC